MVFQELEILFESDTIKPTFSYAHVLLSLLIFEQNPKGIGRYRLKEELLIGSGTARSLIDKLKTKTEFIEVKREGRSKSNKRSGHVLTRKGKTFLKKFKQKIPLLVDGNLPLLEEIIIETKKIHIAICLVKNGANKMKYGVEQRDAAIMIGGSGATCLQYNGNVFEFPSVSIDRDSSSKTQVNKKIQSYLEEIVDANDSKLERGDVIIIGLGDSIKKSRLASLNSALTLI